VSVGSFAGASATRLRICAPVAGLRVEGMFGAETAVFVVVLKVVGRAVRLFLAKSECIGVERGTVDAF
jgi:hypothetical protein